MTTLRKPATKDFQAHCKDQYGSDIALAVNYSNIAFSQNGIVSAAAIPNDPAPYPTKFRITAVAAGTVTLTFTGRDAAGNSATATEEITVEESPKLTTITLTPLN